MSTRFLLSLSFALFAAPLGTGCAPLPRAQTEVVYTEAEPLPPAEVEVVPVSPGPEYFWVAGHNRWDGRRYVWVGGHYDRRPQSGATFVRGHWEHRGRVNAWIDGHWT